MANYKNANKIVTHGLTTSCSCYGKKIKKDDKNSNAYAYKYYSKYPPRITPCITYYKTPCKTSYKKPCKKPKKKKPACCKVIKDCDGIEIEKNILSECRVFGQSEGGSLQRLITYEIIIKNNTDCRLTELSLIDTFVGAFTDPQPTNLLQLSLETVACSGNVVLLSQQEVLQNKGQLVNVDESYIKPCSACIIILKITLSFPEQDQCEISVINNSVVLNGVLEDKCYNYKQIKPIIAKQLNLGGLP